MLDWSEIILRLGIATLAGAAVGLNRDLHGKPVGVRTLALVSLATAMLMTLADPLHQGGFTDAGSRIVQGIVTGIGFLGAGVIFHAERHFRIRGLTSAACVWLTACIGIMCGAGQWRLVVVSLAMAFAVLLFGGKVERLLHGAFNNKGAFDGKDAFDGKGPFNDKGDPTSRPMDAPQLSDDGPHQPGK